MLFNFINELQFGRNIFNANLRLNLNLRLCVFWGYFSFIKMCLRENLKKYYWSMLSDLYILSCIFFVSTVMNYVIEAEKYFLPKYEIRH